VKRETVRETDLGTTVKGHSEGLTAAERGDCVWLELRVVAGLNLLSGRTGVLRHP
jgi:hypothetical protein